MVAIAGGDHDGGMEFITEGVVGSYLSSLFSPGLLLTAAASVCVLITGLGAKLVEAAEAMAQKVSGNRPEVPPLACSHRPDMADCSPGLDPLSPDLAAVDPLPNHRHVHPGCTRVRPSHRLSVLRRNGRTARCLWPERRQHPRRSHLNRLSPDVCSQRRVVTTGDDTSRRRERLAAIKSATATYWPPRSSPATGTASETRRD